MSDKSDSASDSVDGHVDPIIPHTVSARAVGWTRYIALVPILGLGVSALTLACVAVFDVVVLLTDVIFHHPPLSKVIVGFIEVTDVFLLVVVLYIMALGLYELFIDDQLPLPPWLVVRSLEDLKEKLVGVVVVVLAVFFLGQVIEATNALNLLYLGVGIAAVIAALAYFASSVLLHKGE